MNSVPKLRKQKSKIVKLRAKTNQKLSKEQKLQQFMKEFEEIYKLKELDKGAQSIIPSYQSLRTSYQKKSRKGKRIIVGLVGLKNLGNTCYINSSIQLLSNLQPFSDYFQDQFQLQEINRTNPLSTKGRIAVGFGNLIKSVWQMDIQKLTPKGIPVVVPEEFINVVQSCSQFGRHTQEDAQEFLLYLLDIIHEDLNRVAYPPPEVNIREYSEVMDLKELEKLAALSWRDYLLRGKSIVIDLMQGQLKNVVSCKECHFQSYKFEPLMYLSLPIPEVNDNNCTIMDCIKDYLKEETLGVDNMWFCEKCNKKVNCLKKIDLWKLPTILLIHLKRFKYTEDGFIKNLIDINFPVDSLNLTYELPKLQKEKPIYELLGVICHSGTINKGHYYTIAKSKENYKWYLFNDKQVKEVKPEDIPQSQVYVLMYGKSTIPLIKRQTISFPDNWPHVIK